jgi:uncharacterized tellurite resistance protein B-like protein
MNTLERKKLNLLVHLAKADGKFDKSERQLLKEFASEKGLNTTIVNQKEQSLEYSELTRSEERIELLFWALKLMHADNVLHEKELLFCKKLATKLSIKEEIVTRFDIGTLPSLDEFKREVKRCWMTGV